MLPLHKQLVSVVNFTSIGPFRPSSGDLEKHTTGGGLHKLQRSYGICWLTLGVPGPAYLYKTPWLLVRKRTIPTERRPLVGEVSANFLRIEGVAWSVQQIPTVINIGFLDRSRYFSIQVDPQLSSRG
jgi:hypothetical protein